MLVCPASFLYFHSMGIRLSGLTMKSCLCRGLGIMLETIPTTSVSIGVEVNFKMALLFLVLLLGPYVSSELTNQPCKYPAIRLPRPNKKYFLECMPSQFFEEKECPAGTEFDIGLMNCAYKTEPSSPLPPTWVSSELSGDDGFSKTQSVKQPNSQNSQWPFYPIELYSSCTSDGWCPHDPAKLQFCDVNGEQFMQCSNMGWILKMCPPGSVFTGNLGRCVDPRENIQPFPQTSKEIQPKGKNAQNQNQVTTSGVNYPSTKITNTPHINLILPKPKTSYINTNEAANFGQLPQTATLPRSNINSNTNQFVPQYPGNTDQSTQQYPHQYQQSVNTQDQYYSMQPNWNQGQPDWSQVQPNWNQGQPQSPQGNAGQSFNLQGQQPQTQSQQLNGLQSQLQSNSVNGPWVQVQQPSVYPDQTNPGQQTWPNSQQPQVPTVQQPSVQSPITQQNQNQQNWANSQTFQSLVSGQTVQLTPAEAAKYPRGQLVWTIGKQPTSLQAQPQLSLGSLVVDVSNLPEPWATMDFPSFIAQNPSEETQQHVTSATANSNYQSWTVPPGMNPNASPSLNNNAVASMNSNLLPNLNNNNVVNSNNIETPSSFSYPSAPTNQVVGINTQSPATKVPTNYQVGGQPMIVGVSINGQTIPFTSGAWNQSAITANRNQGLYQNNYAAASVGTPNQWSVQNGRIVIPVVIPQSSLGQQPYYPGYQWPNYSYGANTGTGISSNGWTNSNQQYAAAPNWVTQPYQQTLQQSQVYSGQQQTVPSWTDNQVQVPGQVYPQQSGQTYPQQPGQTYPQQPNPSNVRYPFDQRANYDQSLQSSQSFIVGQNSNNIGQNFPGTSVTKSTNSRLAKSRQAKIVASQNKNISCKAG